MSTDNYRLVDLSIQNIKHVICLTIEQNLNAVCLIFLKCHLTLLKVHMTMYSGFIFYQCKLLVFYVLPGKPRHIQFFVKNKINTKPEDSVAKCFVWIIGT